MVLKWSVGNEADELESMTSGISIQFSFFFFIFVWLKRFGVMVVIIYNCRLANPAEY